MANNYQWYSTASSCPSAVNPQAGWYSGSTFITSSYKNPSTGLAYTPAELASLSGGGTTATTGGTTGQIVTISPEDYLIRAGKENTPENIAWAKEALGQIEQKFQGQMTQYGYLPDYPEYKPTTTPTTTPTIPTVTPPAVTPAPPYEISPEQKAWEDKYSAQMTDWLEAGGYGIPEDVQAQMIQAQTDALKAKETEDIRVMRNNMERRGITNSGFVFSNEQAIRSNTSVTLANSIRDVQISSALMKLASFEKAMGAAGQFLGYLSEQSQLKNQPKYLTWQAEQMAKMQAWQAEIDFQKMAINQAYQQQNLQLQAQLTSQLNEQQFQYDLQLAEMEIEANAQAAKAEGAGNIFGTIIGGIFSWITG